MICTSTLCFQVKSMQQQHTLRELFVEFFTEKRKLQNEIEEEDFFFVLNFRPLNHFF